jgi:TolB-like protein
VTAAPDDGFWAGLRRRKVVQWGIAYVAAAWGLLQGFAYLISVFGWPPSLQRPVTMALLIGLPIALVLAWYHGDRGHQRVSGREFTILTVLLLLGGGLFWWVGRPPVVVPATTQTVGPATSEAPPAAAAKSAGASIAVLPFLNMSDDKGNEFFSDGITEELLNVLVRVPGLGVASRTSSFAYKGSTLGTSAIASALKVNHVLEGSVRKAGNKVRITAQLIDATNDRHLWSETYDRELIDIFAIQEEIANAIVAALRNELGPTPEAAPPAVTVKADTSNLEAYQLYLKARELFIARKDLAESMRLLEQVTQMDPRFARGWEGLAAVYSVATSWNFSGRDFPALTRAAATRALELDPTLSMPWAALGSAGLESGNTDWARVFDLYSRAIAADEHNATAYLWRGIGWVNTAFFDRALADFDRCLAIDPLYSNCTRWKAVALLYAGRTDEALRIFAQGVEVGFVTNRAESFILPLVKSGDRVGAIMLLRELGASTALVAAIIRTIDHPSPIPAAQIDAMVKQIEANSRPGVLRLDSMSLFLWFGEYERMSESDQALSFATPQWNPAPPGFRNSPTFKRILNDLRVPEYWREHGFPPLCRPVGASDFTCDEPTGRKATGLRR